MGPQLPLQYSAKASEATALFAEELERHENFDEGARSAADEYMATLRKSADDFLGTLKRNGGNFYMLTQETDDEKEQQKIDIHAQAVAYMLTGTPEFWAGYTAVVPSEMLMRIGKEISEFLKADIPKHADVYAEFAVGVLRDKIIKKHPDLVLEMNPTQQTLEDSAHGEPASSRD